MTMEANSYFNSKPYVTHIASNISRPVSRTHKQMIVHQVITTVLPTTELDMANTVVPSDIDAFITDAAWSICSTYHTVLKASTKAAIFGLVGNVADMSPRVVATPTMSSKNWPT